MTTWKKLKLGDVCLQITDGKHGDCENQAGSGYYFISSKDVYGGSIHYEDARQITEEGFVDTHRRTKLAPGDVLITNSGTIGRMAFISHGDKVGKTTFQKSVAILKPDKELIDNSFLYYCLLSKYKQLVNLGGGSAQHNLLLGDLRSFDITVPDLPIQQLVSSVLSAYDDLIENNERRINVLEEMAQRLYTEWFVKFRFPGHEQVKMVDSGTEYGMIPEGWEVKKLGEIAELVMGQSPTSNHYNLEKQGLPFHQGVADFGSKYPKDRVYSTAGNKYAESGDLLFSVRAPVGRMNIANKKIILGRGLSAIRHKEGFQSLLYLMFTNRFTEKDMIGNGAIYKSVNKAELENLQFIVPSDDISKYFDGIISLYFLQMEKTTASNFALSKTRDFLIPQLVTGKRSVETGLKPVST